MNREQILQKITIKLKLDKENTSLFIAFIGQIDLATSLSDYQTFILNDFMRKKLIKIENQYANTKGKKKITIKFELPEAVAVMNYILGLENIHYPLDYIKNELHKQIVNYLPTQNFMEIENNNKKLL